LVEEKISYILVLPYSKLQSYSEASLLTPLFVEELETLLSDAHQDWEHLNPPHASRKDRFVS